jgi:hypothetical protein
MSLPERSPSPTPTIGYDSRKMVKHVRSLGLAIRNTQWNSQCTCEEARDNSVRTFEWVYGHKPDDIAEWLQTLDQYNGKRRWFLDLVADVCKKSNFDAFDLITENRPRINSIQEQIQNSTAGEAAHRWLMDLRKVNISETAVQKLQDYREMEEAQARELLIEHIDSVIGIHETQVSIAWDDAQSVWVWGWIEDNVPDPPQKRLKSHHDEKEDVAPASPRRAASTNTLAHSDA